MSDLNPCKRCGMQAVEQIRSEQPTQFSPLARNPETGEMGFDEPVELNNPDAHDDYRICCSKFPRCPNHTGWTRPTLKEVARLKETWNHLNALGA